MQAILFVAATVLAFGGPANSQIAGSGPPPLPRENLQRLFTPPYPACRTWTDGCVSCVNIERGGQPVCQDISIPGSCAGRSVTCTQEHTDGNPGGPE
jgi:hypothetical protein